MGAAFRHSQRSSGAYDGKLGFGLLAFVAERKGKEDVAVEAGRFVHASRHLVGARQRQLEVGVVRNWVGQVLVKNLQGCAGIVLLERQVGNHHRQPGHEDALRIFGGKAGQERLGIRELAGFHESLGREEVCIIVHGLAELVGFLEAGCCFGITVID